MTQEIAAPAGSPANGRAADEPDRAALEWLPEGLDAASFAAQASRRPGLAALMLMTSLFVALIGLGGILLTCWAVWSGRIRSVWRFASHRLPEWSLGELARMTALVLMMASLLPYQGTGLDPHVWMTLAMLGLDVFVILVILAFAHGKGLAMAELLGLSGRAALRSMAVGAQGYLAAFPWLLLLLAVIVQIARRVGFQPPLMPIHELIARADRPEILVPTLLLACLVGPVAEECFFRGVLYAALRRRASRWLAAAVSGGLFALVHTNVVGFLPIMALGGLLAHLYDRTGSLAVPMVIHAFHNTLLMAAALLVRAFMSSG